MTLTLTAALALWLDRLRAAEGTARSSVVHHPPHQARVCQNITSDTTFFFETQMTRGGYSINRVLVIMQHMCCLGILITWYSNVTHQFFFILAFVGAWCFFSLVVAYRRIRPGSSPYHIERRGLCMFYPPLVMVKPRVHHRASCSTSSPPPPSPPSILFLSLIHI